MSNWKGAPAASQPSSPDYDKGMGSRSGSTPWKGVGEDDARPKSNPDAAVPGRINIPKG